MSCFSQNILDYFYNIQNTGRIIKPEAIGRAGSKSEGTVIEFSWRVEEGIIKDARFRTFGDVNAIAISSIIATMVVGKDVEEVLTLKPEDILEHLRESKPNYLYFAHLGLEALANAYENYIKKYREVNRRENKFASSLREDLTKIETGEFVSGESYNLSDFAEREEADYLQNLNAYESHREEEIQSIEDIISNNFNFIKQQKISNQSQGRGRPRKERTPEELEAIALKQSRGRGRPRKERTPEEIEAELNKVSRGRGRPRKERTPEELEALANKVVRGRGRPRKERTPEQIEAELNKVSRGRGRPKKERTAEELEALASKPSRGRGRPRKERTAEELEAESNKIIRGRGRPRKEFDFTNANHSSLPKSNFSYMNSFNNYSQSLSSFAPLEEEIEEEQNEIKEVIVDVPSYDAFNRENLVEDRVSERDKDLLNETVDNDENTSYAFSKDYNANLEDEEDSEELYEDDSDEELLAESYLDAKRGRGRPRKERTPEELEELANKVVRGRGRPRKERTPEEIEAELNKVARGRGRPRKVIDETTELEQGEKRGRGRPRKPVDETDIQQAQTEKRGRGRPKKYTAIVIQNLKQNDNNNFEENYFSEDNHNVSNEYNKLEYQSEALNNAKDEKELEETKNSFNETVETNSFAPAQNKYGVGLTSLNNVYKTKKVTIRHEEITNSTVTKEEYNFTKTHLTEEENPEIEVEKVETKKDLPKDDTKSLKELMEEDDVEPTEKTNLSDNINNILSSGGSIADALKALMDD